MALVDIVKRVTSTLIPYDQKASPMATKILKVTLVASLLLPLAVKAEAVENKYHVTEAEKTACGPDAVSLCGDVGENEDKLLTCMKVNRASLTSGCRTVSIRDWFAAGFGDRLTAIQQCASGDGF